MKTIDHLGKSFRDLERQIVTLKDRIYEHNRITLRQEKPLPDCGPLTRFEMRARVDRIKIAAEKVMENVPSDLAHS